MRACAEIFKSSDLENRCPTATWMKGKVAVSWTAEIEEI
jgi:hypothetical protein